MPILTLIVGIIALLGGGFLVKNDVGEFGTPIFLVGLLCVVIGAVTTFLVYF